MLVAPPPLDPVRTALFVDLDGTLTPIVDRPELVGPDAARRRLLGSLSVALSGRLAVISGRALADIDRILEGGVTAVAAVHGLVRRSADGAISASAVGAGGLAGALDAFHRLAIDHPGLLVEDKQVAASLHYRAAPERAADCQTVARDLAGRFGLAVQDGDMVVELRAPGPDKGDAVAAFMREAPFAGFRPVFIGDDFTDENGFRAAIALGGGGVIVGPRRPTLATHALADTSAVLAWLGEAVGA